MHLKRFCATTAAFFALSTFGPHSFGVRAQDQQAAACRPGWEWNRNSLGQDACFIASALDAGCRGVGSYFVPAMNSTQSYRPPQRNLTNDLQCDCNTVMYNMYMACTTCQGGVVFSWPRWMTQCDNGVYVADYPNDIALETAIPRWAYYNVTAFPDQTYNDSVAISIGRDPEGKPKQVNTISSTIPSSSSTLPRTRTSSSTSSGSTSVGNTSSGGSNTGAIVGGVVGGVVPLAILAVVAFIYLKRRKQNGGEPDTQRYSEYKTQPVSPSLGPRPMSGNPYYKPGDPTTYPTPLGDGQSSLTYVPPGSPPTYGRGQFSGVPEL